MNLFKRKTYVPVNAHNAQKHSEEEGNLPEGTWIKCARCGKTVFNKELDKFKMCPNCGCGFRLKAKERLRIIADKNSFIEFDPNMIAKNPMEYPNYEEKIDLTAKNSKMNDAVLTGMCTIRGINSVICIMDSHFIMGSMGSVVGEKITRAFEYATDNGLPILIYTASGGARMQEGIISLMQMAKVSSAAAKHAEKGLLYITIITDPTTGGVTASFAMLGDIILAEPKALIGFAGRRVIEQTIKQQLPEDFQTSEFLLEHGFIDKIVDRRIMRVTIYNILKIHGYGGTLNG